MNKLNVTKVELANKEFFVSNLRDMETLPKYGVVFNSGMVISCPFAHHMYAYTIGVILSIAQEVDLDYKSKGIYDYTGELITGRGLVNKINESTSADGLISSEDALSVFSLGKLNLWRRAKEECDAYIEEFIEMGIVLESKDVAFITPNGNHNENNDILVKWAESWLRRNGKYVWAIRVMLYMTDKEWWTENSKSTWNNHFKEMLDMKLPPVTYMTQHDIEDAYTLRYKIPDMIKNADKKHRESFARVMEDYPKVRRIMGLESHYGSTWDTTYFELDLDDYLFDEEVTSVHYERTKKAIESLDEGEFLEINDNGVTVKLMREDIVNLTCASRVDEAYLSFKAPYPITLRKEYEEGDVISGFVIDELVSLSINKCA